MCALFFRVRVPLVGNTRISDQVEVFIGTKLPTDSEKALLPMVIPPVVFVLFVLVMPLLTLHRLCVLFVLVMPLLTLHRLCVSV